MRSLKQLSSDESISGYAIGRGGVSPFWTCSDPALAIHSGVLSPGLRRTQCLGLEVRDVTIQTDYHGGPKSPCRLPWTIHNLMQHPDSFATRNLIGVIKEFAPVLKTARVVNRGADVAARQ